MESNISPLAAIKAIAAGQFDRSTEKLTKLANRAIELRHQLFEINHEITAEFEQRETLRKILEAST